MTQENIIEYLKSLVSETLKLNNSSFKKINEHNKIINEIINKLNEQNKSIIEEINQLKEQNKSIIEKNKSLELDIHYLKFKNNTKIDYDTIEKRNEELNKEFKN